MQGHRNSQTNDRSLDTDTVQASDVNICPIQNSTKKFSNRKLLIGATLTLCDLVWSLKIEKEIDVNKLLSR